MTEEMVTRAREIIDMDGEDGYRSAANLVGPDEADKLLAGLVARNMETTPDDVEVRRFVAAVRARKGFSGNTAAPDQSTGSATIKDVHQALSRAHDIITVTSTARSCLSDGEHHTDYDANWRRSFDEKANALVRLLAEEFGSGWATLPRDTKLDPKSQNAFREVQELLSR